LADAADAAFAGRGLVPKHIQGKVAEKKDPPVKNRNKNVFANANIALLSMIVEATDSDNLVRIDTVEESENENTSGTEPEEDSEISESELATSARPAVLEDNILAASGPAADMLMSASQDSAMDVQNVYACSAAGEVRPAPSTRVHSDFFMPAPAEDAARVAAVPGGVVSTEERAAFISADTTPGAPVLPRAGLSGEKALSSGAASAKPATTKQNAGKQASTSIKTPPPRVPKVPSMSIARSSPGSSGIPRGTSFRSRSQISQRAMSMDSEAGGDECSLASHKLDSSWDDFDPRDGGDDCKQKGGTEKAAAPAIATTPAVQMSLGASGTGEAIPHPDLAADADPGFPPPTGGMIAARSSGLRLPIADAEDDSVLLGVSKMLMVLRGHVSKTRSKYV
jgi:hypothetical protein